MTHDPKRIMITGAAGQIGSELAARLRKRYGAAAVLVTDIVKTAGASADAGPVAVLDVTDRAGLGEIIRKHRIDTV